MSVKIRLQRHGRKQAPFYHIVVANSRSPRDGKFIERIGIYNPMTSPATIELDNAKALQWLYNGAQPTDTVQAILRFKGVMLRKHLQLGVSKGSITQEVADERYNVWDKEKTAKIDARVLEAAAKKEANRLTISGVAKPKPVAVVVEAAVETHEAPAAEVSEVTDAPE